MKEPQSLMVKCECHGHALEVTHCPNTDGTNEYWFTVWKRGYDGRLCWRERIRWCWNILRTGRPWGDEIILTPGCANQICEFINQHLKDDAEPNK